MISVSILRDCRNSSRTRRRSAFFSRVKRPCFSAFYFRVARLIRARHHAFDTAFFHRPQGTGRTHHGGFERHNAGSKASAQYYACRRLSRAPPASYRSRCTGFIRFNYWKGEASCPLAPIIGIPVACASVTESCGFVTRLPLCPSLCVILPTIA
jgi:hypothetical protein